MSEEEESLNKFKNNQDNHRGTYETRTFEETVEATNDNFYKNKNTKSKKSLEITMTNENFRKPQYYKPKKTRLSKTQTNL